MNIFQKVKSAFKKLVGFKKRDNLHESPPIYVKPEPVKYEAKRWTRRQWKQIKHKRQISARSRMYNLMNA